MEGLDGITIQNVPRPLWGMGPKEGKGDFYSQLKSICNRVVGSSLLGNLIFDLFQVKCENILLPLLFVFNMSLLSKWPFLGILSLMYFCRVLKVQVTQKLYRTFWGFNSSSKKWIIKYLCSFWWGLLCVVIWPSIIVMVTRSNDKIYFFIYHVFL